MKKAILLMAMFAMTLGFTACSDDEEEDKKSVVPSGMTIQANTEGDPITLRSALQGDDQNGYKVVWSKGDKIVVGSRSLFYLSDGAGTTNGTFVEQTSAATSTLVNNNRYDVLYGLTSKSLPETQKYVEGQISNVPMHAQITVTNGKPTTAKLKNLCGVARLTVKSEETTKVKSITLSANKPIAGQFEIDYSGIVIQGNGATSITLDCSPGATLTPKGTDFYIALPPNNYSDVKIAVTDINNATQTQTFSFDIERAKITPISFTIGYFLLAEAVDLGLSSGLRWANHNIGAGKPEEYGNHYAWGETSTKEEPYTWDTYFDTSCTAYSQTGNTVLDLKNDVAHTAWGKNWRMPTYQEIEELVKECYWAWTTSYNNTEVAGYIVYKADDQDKGNMTNTNEKYSQSPSREYTLSDNHIFLPAAGHHYNNDFVHTNSSGYYWSSSLYQGENKRAYAFYFNKSTNNNTYWIYNYYRFYGSTVRAVWAE